MRKPFETASACESCFANQFVLPSGSSDDLSVLALKELSVRVVDCMKTPGLNGQIIHRAAGQSYPGVEVELKENDEQLETDQCFENPQQMNVINPELDQHLEWCHTDLGAEINLYKEEAASECDDRDPNWEESEARETDELQPSHAGADGTLLVFQQEGSSGGVTWLIQDHKLSESLKSAMLSGASSNSEVRQEEACCKDARSQHSQKNCPADNIATAEQRGTEAGEEAGDVGASEPGAGGKCFFTIENLS